MFDKTIADYAGLEEPYAIMAEDRVAAEPQLSPYHDILIDYDWPNQAEHWEWVATAPIDEIVAWAADIRADEADDTEEPEPFKYPQVTRHSITLYPRQVRAAMALAHERHEGKKSPAIQEIIDRYIVAVAKGADDAS